MSNLKRIDLWPFFLFEAEDEDKKLLPISVVEVVEKDESVVGAVGTLEKSFSSSSEFVSIISLSFVTMWSNDDEIVVSSSFLLFA